jgi:hypothetical protein
VDSSGAPSGRKSSTAAAVTACARCVVAPALRDSDVRDSDPAAGAVRT